MKATQDHHVALHPPNMRTRDLQWISADEATKTDENAHEL